jgi:hypothetical protein
MARDTALTLEMIPNPLVEAARLDRAATVVELRGWCQFHLSDEAGRVCAIGAYKIVVGGTPLDDAYGLVALGIYLGVRSIGDWNDERGRTARQVTAALRATAAALREIARGREQQ